MKRVLLVVLLLVLFVVPPAGAAPLVAPDAPLACSGLFFSEYIEGSSSNKALEIFNGTTAAVNLSGYTVELYANGAITPGNTATLSGSLAAGDVYVIANSAASAAILAVADTTSTVTYYNGDDAIALKYNGTIIDVIGQIGVDPGTVWGTEPITTAEHTLRRKSTISTGDAVGSDAFNPATEWDGYAQDTIDGLGAHSAACYTSADPAPYVDSTTPSSGTTGVAPGTDITIKFSELVNVTDAWYTLSCTSGTHAAAASTSDNINFTLNPDLDFTAGESCTVTLEGDYITDQGANHLADYSWSFTIDSAPTVSSTNPGSGATDVSTTANVGITFSEPVNVTSTWYTITCTPSGSHSATVSGGPSTWTLNPDVDFTAGESCTVTLEADNITDQDGTADNLAEDYSWSFTVASGTVASIIINELDSDTPSTDVLEFVELYDGGVGNTSLTGKVVVFFNGSDDKSYAAYDLDGYATNASGYFLLGNTAVVPAPSIAFADNFLQNGADAVALYTANAADFPNGTAVSTANLVDAIVYDTADADDTGLLVLHNASQPQVNESSNSASATESNQRCPNGSGGQRNTLTYLQHTPTAGAANNCPEYDPPRVSSTTPTSGETGVSTGTTITINFNEIVDLADGAFMVECPAGTTVGFTVSPTLPASDTSSVVLTPSSALPAETTCTVTAVATAITDNDSTMQYLDGNGDGNGNDDYSFTFTTAAVDPCTLSATLISAIQGSGATSPSTGSNVTIQGIVVGDYETGGMEGYFVQEEDSDWDSDPATSEGIFVYDANATSEVSLGDKVRVAGTVAETYSLTELQTTTSPTICSSGQGSLVKTASVSLPADSSTYLERYEGMWVTFPQELTVTDNYNLGRYGELTLSQGGKLWQFTHLNVPSISGYATYLGEIALRSILLDDGSTTQNLDPIFYPGTGLTAANTVRVDDTITGLTGVLDYDYGVYRLQPIGQVAFTAANQRSTTPPAVGGNVKVGAFNTLNFFVTTGAAYTCGPSGTLQCRGATDATEFTRQRDKLVAAICGLNADVLGLMELENPRSTATTDPVLGNLVTALNASSACPDDYAFIDNAWAGTDAIRQGLIYKSTVVTPVGTTAILDSTAFINGGDGSARNRPALTQAFQMVSGDKRFIVSVNHLKSKGSACDDPDTLDGQANCAMVRTNAASALATWLAGSNPTGTGDPDILIMGDLNSYAQEDPITTLAGAGFSYTDLINHFGVNSSERYGYAFDGMMGYLDHALASPTLLAQATGAGEWHINSPEPAVLDYNTEYKSTGPTGQVTTLYNADAYRSTDHDPVIVGLNLQSETAVTLGTFEAAAVPLAGWPAAAGLGALGIVLLARRRRK